MSNKSKPNDSKHSLSLDSIKANIATMINKGEKDS